MACLCDQAEATVHETGEQETKVYETRRLQGEVEIMPSMLRKVSSLKLASLIFLNTSSDVFHIEFIASAEVDLFSNHLMSTFVTTCLLLDEVFQDVGL